MTSLRLENPDGNAKYHCFKHPPPISQLFFFFPLDFLLPSLAEDLKDPPEPRDPLRFVFFSPFLLLPSTPLISTRFISRNTPLPDHHVCSSNCRTPPVNVRTA